MWPNFVHDDVIEIMISIALLLALPVFPAASPLVLPQEPSLRWRLEEIRTHEGSLNDNAFGFYVNNCGDLNGDGVGEYLIGSPGDAKEGKQVGGVQVRSGKDGRLLFQLYGKHEASNFGRIALGVGDVDGDGVDDFAVGATRESADVEECGSLRIYSGACGKVIHEWFGSEPFDKFGRSLAILDDADKDGISEILVGGYQPNGLHDKGRGYVRLYSGQCGRLLRTLRGLRPRDMFGVTMCGTGDLTGDDVRDFVVGSFYARRLEPGRQPSQGSVCAFNGRSGELIWRKFADDFTFAENASNNPTFGRKVCCPGDLNDDGIDDVLVAAPLWDADGEEKNDNRGMVIAISGKDGTLLPGSEMQGSGRGYGLGHSLAPMGDVDGDGVGDFLVGAMAGGFVELRSGKDFSVLARVKGQSGKSMFGQSIRAVGDLDGDGRQEIIIGEPAARVGEFKKAGLVHIYRLVANSDM